MISGMMRRDGPDSIDSFNRRLAGDLLKTGGFQTYWRSAVRQRQKLPSANGRLVEENNSRHESATTS